MQLSRNLVRRLVLGAGFTLVFAAGYGLGTLDVGPAAAQVDLGKELLNKASESGGIVGTAAELGTTITDMQTNVSALQKNIDSLNKIKAALGG
jgi:hypothetical protein